MESEKGVPTGKKNFDPHMDFYITKKMMAILLYIFELES